MSESKVTNVVKEGVFKAFNAGEDLIKGLGKITKEVVKTIKDEDLNTKEKFRTLAKEALDGAVEGAKKAQPPTEEFVKKAAKTICETIKENAPKVAHFTQEVYEGIKEGTKEIKESKKCCGNCSCEEEEEEIILEGEVEDKD